MDYAAIAAAAVAELNSDPDFGRADPQDSEETAAAEDAPYEGELEAGEQELTDPDLEDSEELADGEEPEEESANTDGPLVVDPEQEVTYGGQTAKASDLFEIKAMATRKTQEAAEARKEALELAEEARGVLANYQTFTTQVIENPTAFTGELIEAGYVDRVELARSILTGANDDGMSFMELLGLLADDEVLPASLVEAFELDNPAHPARKHARTALKTRQAALAERRRVADLERQVAQAASQAPAADEPGTDVPAAVGSYTNESDVTTALADIASTYGLPTDPELGLEPALAAELIEFAQADPDRYGTDLEKAYLALAARKQATAAAATKQASSRSAAAAAKKRAGSAVSARTTSPVGSRTPSAKAKPMSPEDAAAAAVAEVFGQKR